MEALWNWLTENYQWFLGRVSIAVVAGVILIFLKRMFKGKQQTPEDKPNIGGDNISTEGDYSPGKVGGDYVAGDKYEAPKPEPPKKS